jgi:hypothetical protein
MGFNLFSGVGDMLFPGDKIISNEKNRRDNWQNTYDTLMGDIKPWNISGPTGNLTYEDGELKWSPNEDFGNYINMLTGSDAQARMKTLLGGESGTDFTAGVLGQMRDLASPYEQRAREDLDAKLHRMGILSSNAGQYQSQALYDAQAMADKQRMLDAYGLRENLLGGEMSRMNAGWGMGMPPQALAQMSMAGMKGFTDKAGVGLSSLNTQQSQQRTWDLNWNQNAKDAWSMIMAGFGMNTGSGKGPSTSGLGSNSSNTYNAGDGDYSLWGTGGGDSYGGGGYAPWQPD